jgi:hypothetical protein
MSYNTKIMGLKIGLGSNLDTYVSWANCLTSQNLNPYLLNRGNRFVSKHRQMGEGGGGERVRRMNMVQILCTHV